MSVADRSYVYVARKNGKAGLLDKDGKIIVAFEYDELNRSYYTAATFVAVKDGLKGVPDAAGKVVLPIVYSTVTISDKTILLKKGDKHGLVNADFTEILPVKYDLIKSLLR